MTTDAFRRMIDIIEDVEGIQSERKEYLELVKKLDDKLDDLGVEWVDLVKEVSTTIGAFQFPGSTPAALPTASVEPEVSRKTHEAARETHKAEKRPQKRSKSRGSVDAKYAEAVLIYISSAKDPVSSKQIREVVGGTAHKFRTTVLRLLEQGKILKTGMTRNTKYHNL